MRIKTKDTLAIIKIQKKEETWNRHYNSNQGFFLITAIKKNEDKQERCKIVEL
jgi:hypothetical protein